MAAVCFSSCNTDDNRYETRYSADGKDSVVYVHYRDNNGNYQDFWMNYLIFKSLYNNGGYANCYTYYHSHPVPRINNYHYYTVQENRSSFMSNRPKSTYTGSSGSSTVGSTKKSWWSSGSSSSKSYTSPSRSYSSPSRSYSSPSRSYSSPSRSYSSPSRSFGGHH